MSKFKQASFASTLALAVTMPAWGQDIIPPKVDVTTPSGISVVDASFAYTETDFSIGPLKLERFLITGPTKARDTLIGRNMTHNFDIYVAANNVPASPPGSVGGVGKPASTTPIVHIGNSSRGQYVESPGNLSSIAGNNMDGDRAGILSWVGGSTYSSGHYVFTDRDGTIYTFTNTVSAAGVLWTSERVAQIDFPDGRQQIFTYNSSGQLKLVSDSSGYAVVFDYDSAGRTSAACGFNLSRDYVTASSTCTGAPLKVGYAYDSGNLLASVTAADGQVTSFPGNTYRSVTCVQPPGYSACKAAITYTNFPGYTAISQTLIDGSTWSAIGSNPDEVNNPGFTTVVDGFYNASFTDPAGKTTSFTFTKSSPRTMTDPLGRITTYTFVGGQPYIYTGSPYYEGTMLAEIDLPEGNKYLAEYNGPFFSITKETMVPKSGSGLSNLVKEYGYSCPGFVLDGACTKPIWVRDPKGNQTDYSYASFGGITSEMQPAPNLGGSRPLKLYTYVQKYAYIKDSGGSLVAAATPIWMPATEILCQTRIRGSSACFGAAPQTQTTYEYGADGTADNLLVRGVVVTDLATGIERRTCYSYDNRGRKISETKPRANLTVCP